MFPGTPKGLFDPFICNAIKWTKARPANKKGNK
jgi:hypothetical protein